uniref:Uncharacterized protein n=1 Tax=Strigops habroptila TaxID=2489341 RepID=A0A672VD86_STRHB
FCSCFLLSPTFCVKAFSHCGHWKGRSPVCTRRCVWDDCRNSFPQAGHPYLRSPVWERRCRARCEEEMNALPQSAQPCGRSPVCVRLWRTSPEERANALAHTEQRYGFSPSQFDILIPGELHPSSLGTDPGRIALQNNLALLPNSCIMYIYI